MKMTLFVLGVILLSLAFHNILIVSADYLARPSFVKRFEGLDYRSRPIWVLESVSKDIKPWWFIWIVVAILLGRIAYRFLTAANQLPW